MKLENWQLIAILVGAFAAVIAVDIWLQYQTDENFRDKFPKLSTAQFTKSRVDQMIHQEMNVPEPEPEFVDEENVDA